jgi:hypothetical protein
MFRSADGVLCPAKKIGFGASFPNTIASCARKKQAGMVATRFVLSGPLPLDDHGKALGCWLEAVPGAPLVTGNMQARMRDTGGSRLYLEPNRYFVRRSQV